MTVKTTSIHINEAKTHLSQYARRLREGERFILCDRNKPFEGSRSLPEHIRHEWTDPANDVYFSDVNLLEIEPLSA